MTDTPEELISFARRLVRTKSVTGDEKAAINIIQQEMVSLGFDNSWVDKYGSAIGVIEGRYPGPTVLLDGHSDTVDANSPDWVHDPWGGEIVNARLYGRGAADMKGSLAAMIHAAAWLDRDNLAGRVLVSATVAEETVEGGAIKHVMEINKPDYVIIGEATELKINRGGRGRAELNLTTYGRSAHSSSPQAGRSAVADMMSLINKISAQPELHHPFLGGGSLVLTDIISVPFPGRSVIPYQCQVTYDRRLLPGETSSSVLDAIRLIPHMDGIVATVEIKANTEVTYTGERLHGEKFFPAWILPEDHSLVQMAFQGLTSAGMQPSIGAYRFCTNAAYSAGTVGIPTIGFGIGSEEMAHTIDESILIDDLGAAMRGYQAIIRAICARG